MPRGGPRPGAGRPMRGGTPTDRRVTVLLTDAEYAEIDGSRRPGETISQLLRDGGLRLVRARKGFV